MLWMNHWKFIDPENSFVLKQDFRWEPGERDALWPDILSALVSSYWINEFCKGRVHKKGKSVVFYQTCLGPRPQVWSHFFRSARTSCNTSVRCRPSSQKIWFNCTALKNITQPLLTYRTLSGACLVVSAACLVASGGVWWCLEHVWWYQCM